MIPPPRTVTNESITIIWKGKTYTVQKSAPNFAGLKQAIETENWESVEKNLTAAPSIHSWAKGKFAIEGNSVLFDGKQLPQDLNNRIIQMAANNEDPRFLFRFWERLQKNPSFRSVRGLWAFLNHQGIPLTKDGCFLAYKGVKDDFTDVHSGIFSNKPGVTNEMPRNEISDDPRQACHEGFHVGSVEYARGFGPRVVVCKVDPEHVVCVPYDDNSRKMRVCKYTVLGNYGSQLPDTTIEFEEMEEHDDDHGGTPHDDNEADLAVKSKPEKVADSKTVEKTKPVKKETTEKKSTPANKSFKKYEKFGTKEMLELSLDELRKYATYGLEIVGASKIPGGKVALVARIMDVKR